MSNHILNRNTVLRLISENFAKGGNPVQGKRGRRYSKSIQDVANDYVSNLPQGLVEGISENPELIGSFINELVRNRRPLTDEEAAYILNGRDAEAMGTLNGEPTQSDIFIRFSVEATETESLGTAFKRRAKKAISFAQEEANELRKTLYVVVERYAVERNLRDLPTATKHNAPLSAVGLMSRNIVALVVTDKLKAYKGAIATVATCSPEAGEIDSLAHVLADMENLQTLTV